jgi:hypothetical protein
MSCMHEGGLRGWGLFATSTSIKKNLNNYLDLNVFMHNKINKMFLFNNSYGHENISMWKGPRYRYCRI